MEIDQKRHLTFPLRLPFSLRDQACELAHQDGISLNHFISLAVAEKISRIEQVSGRPIPTIYRGESHREHKTG